MILQICEDDKLEGWRFNAGEGAGEIESTAPIMDNVCLTAVGSNQGDPVSVCGSSKCAPSAEKHGYRLSSDIARVHRASSGRQSW